MPYWDLNIPYNDSLNVNEIAEQAVNRKSFFC
jgi:hypothetical protein